ncbi:hypothetical protein KKH30_00025 [Candidatus Micrarchaeota archaeon]|nr:hypothetical protein [Candidatus Micrarchaeota archaeon]
MRSTIIWSTQGDDKTMFGKKTKYLAVLPMLIVLAVLANSAVMTSTSYQMEADVFAGGVPGSSASYDMNAIAIGELVAGNISSGSYSAYVGFLGATAEICNSRDDDQDGEIDEGCPWTPHTGTVTSGISSCTYSCGRNEGCPGHTYATHIGAVCCTEGCTEKIDAVDLAIYSYGSYRAGNEIVVLVDLINRGSRPAANFENTLFAMRGDAESSSLSWIEIESKTIALLASGERTRLTFKTSIQELTLLLNSGGGAYNGIVSIGFMADSKSIHEIDEFNNWGSLSIIIGDTVPEPEICCDDIDNDLDGVIDEGFTEICGNLIDDDMDGKTDEGCSVICTDERGDHVDDGALPGEIECSVSSSPGTPLFKDLYGNGFCLNGCDKTLYMYPDGTLAYEENLYGNMSYKHGKLSAKQLADFKTLVETGGFLSLDQDYYNCARAPTDAGSVTYTYTPGSLSKKVGFYAACPNGGDLRFPPSLTELSNELSQIKLLLKDGRAPESTTTVNVFECETDADCINIRDQCCDCNHSGTNTSINRDYEQCWLDYVNTQFNCSHAFCKAMPSRDESCFSVPACTNGLCSSVADGCPSNPPPKGVCDDGDVRKYACPDLTEHDWCFCENGQWQCMTSPESNCGETCGNDIDDNRNGLVDEDCEERCDGIDNDLDGIVDEGCGGEICGDGIDNDADGEIDEDCSGLYEICGNGIDDNRNGLIDEGCGEICGDNIDNDLDGEIDELCYPRHEICGNGIDDDQDGLVDEPPCVTEPDDTDDDGLIDDDERGNGSDPYVPDTDGDLLNDGLEFHEIGTNILSLDSDEDNVFDGQEYLYDITDPVDEKSNLLDIIMEPNVPVGKEQSIGINHPTLGLLHGFSAQITSPSGAVEILSTEGAKITFTVREAGNYGVSVRKKKYSEQGYFEGVGFSGSIGGTLGGIAELIFGSSFTEAPFLVLLLFALSAVACILAYRNSKILFPQKILTDKLENREKLKRALLAALFLVAPLLISRFVDLPLAILFAVLEIVSIYSAVYFIRAKARVDDEKKFQV